MANNGSNNQTLSILPPSFLLVKPCFIPPLFIDENLTKPQPIASMPGIRRETLESVVNEARELAEMDIPAVILFGLPKEKDETGTHAYGDDDVVQNATRAIKAELG
ncbi:MAG: hypothetical protein K8R34_07360, partial [Methanosarcinales archaeon]|nr:hypothetical protein [Methanosarcinales archaeon]